MPIPTEALLLILGVIALAGVTIFMILTGPKKPF